MKRHIIRPYVLYFLFISTAFVPVQSMSRVRQGTSPLHHYMNKVYQNKPLYVGILRDTLTSLALLSDSGMINGLLYGLAATIQAIDGSITTVASITPGDQSLFTNAPISRLVFLQKGYQQLASLPLYAQLVANAQKLATYKRRLSPLHKKALRELGIQRLRDILFKQLPLLIIASEMSNRYARAHLNQQPEASDATQNAIWYLIMIVGGDLIGMKGSGLSVEKQLLDHVAFDTTQPQDFSLSTLHSNIDNVMKTTKKGRATL